MPYWEYELHDQLLEIKYLPVLSCPYREVLPLLQEWELLLYNTQHHLVFQVVDKSELLSL